MDSWLQAQLQGRAADYLLSDDAAYGQFLDGPSVRRASSTVTRCRGDSLYALLDARGLALDVPAAGGCRGAPARSHRRRRHDAAG